MMKHLKFQLPDDLKQFVDQKIREGGYINGPEYMRDLIRQQFFAVQNL